jgi:hypothetical protein
MRRRPPHAPCHRAIVAVDVEASTARTNPDKIALRATLYRLFEAALHAGGITRRHRDPLIDRGDGILALIHPTDHTPKTLLLDTVIPALGQRLTQHNGHHPGQSLRLRAVVHAGEVHYDRRGCFGEALDVTFRLLDAPELKAALRSSSTPLALVVSELIYRSIVRHGYDHINQHAFHPLIRIEITDQDHRGWVHLPQAKGSLSLIEQARQ